MPRLCVILAVVSTCADLLDFAVDLKQGAARKYAEYASRAGMPGLKPLAASLVAQEKEHADALGGIKLRGNLELVFVSPRGPSPEVPSPGPDPGAIRPASEFLRLVLRNVDASIAVFSFLEAHAVDGGVSQILRRLAEEARRTRVMIASRLDLETLGGV